MPELPSILPHIATPAFQAALQVLTELRSEGYMAYFVGGCVRDLLLGHAPKDYDIATDAHPESVMDLFPRTHAVGAHFGVIIVVGEDGSQTEVATFRADGTYEDGRRPTQVVYAETPEVDVLRRDFTINGMMLDPVMMTANHFQEKILDFVGGYDDLHTGLIRAIGIPARRFEEDKLRMLRAIRFAARFSFSIEEQTLQAIQIYASQIHQVSKERIREELTRMLTEGHARHAFELLDETGLLREVLPEVARMKGVLQPPQFHPEGDVWVHTLLLLEKLPAHCSVTLAWAALLHDVGKPPTFRAPDPKKPGDRIRFNGHAEVGTTITRAILNRLRLSNEETEQICTLVANHMRFGDVMQMRPATLKRFFRLPKFEEHLQLHWMDASSAHGDLRLYDFAKQRYEAAPADEIRPVLWLTGHDLVAEGLKPGPRFRELLHEIEDAQLEGRITSKEEALALLHQLLASNPA